MIRVGHSNQISDLFSFKANEQVDYVSGVSFICGILFAFFTLWGIVLLILKCCGKYKVGYLSGGNYQKEIKGKINPRPTRGRVCFSLGTLIFIITAIIFSTIALGKVEDTSYTIADSAVVSWLVVLQSRYVSFY